MFDEFLFAREYFVQQRLIKDTFSTITVTIMLYVYIVMLSLNILFNDCC